jgi:hypothetical protein
MTRSNMTTLRRSCKGGFCLIALLLPQRQEVVEFECWTCEPLPDGTSTYPVRAVVEFECWTCEPLPDGTSTYPVRASSMCRADLHDVRAVNRKVKA